MRSHSNPYSADLAMLRDYLKQSFDPYDWADQLERFYDEERGGKLPKWLDLNDPTDRIVDMSKRDMADLKEWAAKQEGGVETPAYMVMEYLETVSRETWLIHFTNDVKKIISEGIICGHEDMYYGLALTTWFKKKDCRPGWNFAFEVGTRYAFDAAYEHGGHGKYGTDAIMFQTAGVKVHHSGDDEQQVIFRGDAVRGIIPLFRDGDNFNVFTHDDRLLVSAQIDPATSWVEKNAKQYWKQIAYVTGDKR